MSSQKFVMEASSILVVTPTMGELEAFLPTVRRHECRSLLCGVGPGATAFHLTRHLEQKGARIVMLAGVAGAYPWASVSIADVCLARSESYGDLGRCGVNGPEPIVLENEQVPLSFDLEHGMLRCLSPDGIASLGVITGPMVTVSCVSGTEERARMLYDRFGAVAENMEGAAAAQVCEAYSLPLIEIRGISNRVGELDRAGWRIEQALEKTAGVLERVLAGLLGA